MKVNIELTDTFAGEANYSWVRRESFTCDDNASDLSVIRRAKKAIDYNGVRCEKNDFGEMIALRPHNICHVIFITFEYN